MAAARPYPERPGRPGAALPHPPRAGRRTGPSAAARTGSGRGRPGPRRAEQVYDLATARETAAANQPAVFAARDSLHAAELKAATLNKGGLSALLARDLPIRRQQAALGLTIASAAVDQACCDARQAATATYLAALYALEQQRNADAIHNRLTDLKTLAKTALDKGRRDVSTEQMDIIDSYLDPVDGRKQEAIEGYQRALAALRAASSAWGRTVPSRSSARNCRTFTPRPTATRSFHWP